MTETTFRITGTVTLGKRRFVAHPWPNTEPVEDAARIKSKVEWAIDDYFAHDSAVFAIDSDITVTVDDVDLHPVRLTKSQVGAIRHIFSEVCGGDYFPEDVKDISAAIRAAEEGD